MAPLRVAFLHPDLGLGGAERLVVDAAVALAAQGHGVTMYTSHYTAARSFAETRDGTFGVAVAGDWLPRHVGGRLHIVFAVLRAVWLAAWVALTQPRADVFVCDQVSAYVPVLRLLRPATPVLFYCHFPDQLLSARGGWLKAAYRAPFDAFEEWATGLAHAVVVNSRFTAGVFAATFASLHARGVRPGVLYPCIDIDPKQSAAPPPLPPSAPLTFLSINRFERKKDVGLAVRALGELKRRLRPSVFAQLRLVLAGGYDVRVGENVGYYEELKQLAVREGLAPSVDAFTPPPLGSAPIEAAQAAAGATAPAFAQVESCGPLTLVRSFSDEQKRALLAAAAAVVYTPTGEHFGIVPLECMAAYRPVVAVASAGPLESVVDGETGFLCAPTAEAFADALEKLVVAPQRALEMGRAGRAHVSAKFSRAAFGAQLNALVVGLAACEVAGRGAAAAGNGMAEGRPSQRRSARRRL